MAALLSRGAAPGNAQQPPNENIEDPGLFRKVSWESFEKEPHLLRRKVIIKEGQDGNISSNYILQVLFPCMRRHLIFQCPLGISPLPSDTWESLKS